MIAVMENSAGAFLLCITPKSLTIYCSLLALLVLLNTKAAGAGRPDCTPSCGDLQDIRSPLRLQGDPPECGPLQLSCSNDSKATIYMDKRKYFVTRISYDYDYNYEPTFWVVDAELDYRSCPLPAWNHLPDIVFNRSDSVFRLYTYASGWASFVNCSQPVTKNGKYRPVTCLSNENSSSFVYVLTGSILGLETAPYRVGELEPSCGYLAMSPLGDRHTSVPENASYVDVIKLMKKGFAIQVYTKAGECLAQWTSRWTGQISFWDRILGFLFFSVPQLVYCAAVYLPIELRFPAYVVALAAHLLQCIIVLCRFVFAPLVVLTFLAYKFWKTRISIDAVEKFLRMQHALGPTRYAYTDITAITNHFREKLGNGGFGSVYKGVLPGNIHVAVKMLGNSMCDGEDFISEVSTIGRIHHINVVRLVGFCSEELRRALVYECMPCGSLDKYIFSSERSLSWDKLNEIALGIARGIDYLHRGCDMQILHFDIKPHNILLDRNFVPKIADFGLAKLYPKDYSLVSMSAARGTIGYIAPEQISRSFGTISCKSDVYSFGMLLLEMAGGRRNTDQHVQNLSQVYYPSWVYNQLSRQEVCEITEPIHLHEVEKKLCMVGLWCIQMKSHERPTMSEAIEMLEGGVDGLQMPPKPFFCGDEQATLKDSCQFSSELCVITEEVE